MDKCAPVSFFVTIYIFIPFLFQIVGMDKKRVKKRCPNSLKPSGHLNKRRLLYEMKNVIRI